MMYLLIALAWAVAFGIVAWSLRSRFHLGLALLAPLWPLALPVLCCIGAIRLVILAVNDR